MEKYVFGVDIGGTKTAVTLADTDAHFYDKTRFPTEGSWKQVLEKVFAVMENQAQRNRITDIAAVGVSCGGPLDSRRGVILSPPNLPGWDEVPVTELFEKRFGVPCFLQNDADACAVAEWKYGAGRGCENLLFLTFGTGLGAGLILNGRLYSGASGLAGEAGHIRLAEKGPVGYGKAGSFEGFCSGGGIARLAEERMGEPLTAKEVAERAAQGDAGALEVLEISGRYLGLGCSILMDLFNPERIIIGGIYMRCEGLLKPHAEAVIRREALPGAAAACRIVPAGLGEKIGDYSAIAIAAEALSR